MELTSGNIFYYKRKLQTVNLGGRAYVSEQRLYKYAKLPGLGLRAFPVRG